MNGKFSGRDSELVGFGPQNSDGTEMYNWDGEFGKGLNETLHTFNVETREYTSKNDSQELGDKEFEAGRKVGLICMRF